MILDHSQAFLDISWTVPEHFSWMKLVQEMLKCKYPLSQLLTTANRCIKCSNSDNSNMNTYRFVDW